MNWQFIYNLSLILNILSAGVIFFFLIFTVAFRDRGARAYTLLSLGITEWALFFLFAQVATDSFWALKFFTLAKIGLVFTSASFLDFSLIYAESITKKSFKWVRRVVYTYGIALALFFLSDAFFSTQFMFDGGGRLFNLNFWGHGVGLIFNSYVVYFFSCFTAGILTWMWLRQNVEKSKRPEIDFILWPTVVAALGGGTQFLLYYNIYVPPIGTYFIPVYVIGLFYSITKFHLFNLKVVTAELFIFGIWAFLGAQMFLSGNTDNFIPSILVFVLSIVFGLFSLRSIVNEVRQKDQLADLNQNLEAKVAEQTKEIRAAYEVEKEARIKLEELNKEKNDFILASQHNLRTPLTVAKGLTEEIGMRTDVLNNPELKMLADKTKNSLDILAQLVNGLIDVTQLKAGKISDFNKKDEKSKLT